MGYTGCKEPLLGADGTQRHNHQGAPMYCNKSCKNRRCPLHGIVDQIHKRWAFTVSLVALEQNADADDTILKVSCYDKIGDKLFGNIWAAEMWDTQTKTQRSVLEW